VLHVIAVPAHVPFEHVSFVVQALLSSHEAVLFVCVQPVDVLQPSVVQTLPSSQFGAAPPTHVPPLHVSFVVHALPSSHPVPFALFGFVQTPVPVSQVPTSWHWSSAVQTTGFDPVHTPDWQVSVCVQAFESLHAVPFVLLGFEQTPVLVLQTPTSWHWSRAVQTTGFEPVHTPD